MPMADREAGSDGVLTREVDRDIPAALQAYMVGGWGAPRAFPHQPTTNRRAKEERRQRLAERFAGRTLVIPNGRERVRSNDTSFRFRPNTAFLYLLGDGEPGDVLVIGPRGGPGTLSCLYTEPSPSWAASDVISDRERGALWARPHIGLEGAEARYGVPARDLAALTADLAGQRDIMLLRGSDLQLDDRLDTAEEGSSAVLSYLSEMRLIKDPWEVEEIGRACDLSLLAFGKVVAQLGSLKTERDVEILFDSWARTVGEGPGYPTIVASGENATIRHYTRNLSQLDPEKLLLLDGGVETTDYYTADVTRTLPIGGRFSGSQAALYDVVLRAHQAGIAAVRPGVPFRAPHDAAMRALSEGLFELEILKVVPDEAIRADRQFYRRYCRHGTSHMLGIDVHDCVDASPELYRDGLLREGMVLTIEPGAYVQPHDLLSPEEFRGIGIRIEDDVVVTEGGCRVLSEAFPVGREEVEEWVRSEGELVARASL